MRVQPPDCRRLEALVDREIDGELTPEQRAFVDGHLAACASCRDRREFQRRLRRAVDSALAGARPPDGMVARILAALDAEEGAP